MNTVLRIASETKKAIPKRINFTVAAVERLSCPAGKDRLYVFDTKSPGLAVAITATGAKTFYQVYKFLGTPRRYKLGEFPKINVDDARALSAKARGKIANGIDPQLERNSARAETTFGELFKYYIEHHAKPHKRSWEKDQERHDKHLAGWATRKLSQISRQDVQALHTRIGKDHPGAANRVLALLSTVFNKARLMGFEGVNPTQGVTRYKETQRERFLTGEELPAFLKALEAEPNQTWKDFFGLCLWTGARSGNVKTMKWDEVSLEAGTWRIPDEKFKTGHGMTVHLAEPALAILKARKAKATTEYVFPAVDSSRRKSATGHIAEPKAAWAELLKRAGIKDLWIHDLRRTLGSWQAASGASLPVIGKTLGHRNQNTTAIYARLDLNPVKASVDTAVAAMQKTTEAKPEDAKPAKGKRKGKGT